MTPAAQTLATWLLEQIGADEAVARAAVKRISHGSTGGSADWSRRGMRLYLTPGASIELGPLEVAEHVARQDPAHVLAVCEAHRRIVELHSDGNDGLYPGSPPFCRTCEDRDGLRNVGYPCPTLRALAAIYADGPGWREEWR